MKTNPKAHFGALARFTRYPFSVGLILALGLLLTSRPSYAIEAVRVAGGFEMPLGISAPPGDTGRLFIVEQTGRIKIIKLPGGTVNPAPFLNISAKISLGGEQGLLGLAFDPSYASNGRFYVTYTTPGGSFGTCVSHVAEFFVSANPDVADPGSEASLIVVDHPQEQHQMHWMGFSRRPGDEGNLYISSGDGGMFCDMGPGHIEPGGNGQETKRYSGKFCGFTLKRHRGLTQSRWIIRFTDRRWINRRFGHMACAILAVQLGSQN